VSREKGPLPTGLNGGDGRTPGGKFAPGNRLAKGNPNNRRAQQLRNAYIDAVTPEDMREVAVAVAKVAKGGDVAAAKELCDRVIGRPVQQDLLERLERLEELFQQGHNGHAGVNGNGNGTGRVP
jgi:hypothetical protein